MKQAERQQPVAQRPTACPRCRGHLLWQRDEETWTCFTCGWRWYPGMPLPLVLHRSDWEEHKQTGSKACRVCGEEKPVTMFSRHQGHNDGLQSMCKPCMTQYNAERWRRERQQKAVASG